MSVDVESVFKLKAAALMHDPPHKAYLILEGFDHELEASVLSRQIFGPGFDLYLRDARVHVADSAAASFDRWILSLFMGGRYIAGAFAARIIKLKNTLAPWLEFDLGALRDEIFKSGKGSEYVELLKKAVNEVDYWGLKYHILYALYEAGWISKGLPAGPADTRVPTHTVFDHNYATAAVINWLLEDHRVLRGLLVAVDIAGVQEFIGSSRKLRDMWVSSYIVSALTWYTIVELVEKLGPDIVLMPSLRLNPFYTYWLSYKLKDMEHVRNYLGEAEKLAYMNVKEVVELSRDIEMPSYPIIPGRATLILPPWSTIEKLIGESVKGDVEEYFKSRFARGWKVLWEAIEKLIEARASHERGVLWKVINKVFKEYHDKRFSEAGFHEAPPLVLRVSSIRVDKPTTGTLWAVYDEAYRGLSSAMTLSKYSGESPALNLNLKAFTLKAFNSREGLGLPRGSRRGFEYCTSCGSLPAILVLPRDEGEFKQAIEELADGPVNNGELVAVKTVLKPGEKLCPWCFIKRVISVEPRLLKVLLLGYTEDDIRDVSKLRKTVTDKPPFFGFPSVSHLASARLYENMLDVAGKIVRHLDVGTHVSLGRGELKRVLLREGAPMGWWLYEYKLWKKLEELRKKFSEDDALMLDIIYFLDPEYMWFHEDYRRNWESLLRDLSLIRWLWRYYALVKADGDSIGKLLECDLSALVEGLERETTRRLMVEKVLAKYIIEPAEGPYRSVVERSFSIARDIAGKDVKLSMEVLEGKSDFRSLASDIASELGISNAEAKGRLASVIETLTSVIKAERVPVTPSYHVAVSSALMRAAVMDVAVASKLGGFVVYAGGDDLLAFIPVDTVLEFVRSSRLSFAGAEFKVGDALETSNGFLKLKRAYLPMLPAVGRSYVAYIAHYYYPLSTVISRATKLLKDAKEDMRLSYSNGKLGRTSSKKDVLVVAYNPRGPESVARLPLSWSRPMVFDAQTLRGEIALLPEIAGRLACFIDNKICRKPGGEILSRSFLYDFIKGENLNMLEELSRMLGEGRVEALPTMASLVKMLIDRNIKRSLGEEDAGKVYSLAFEPIMPLEPAKPIVGAGRFERESRAPEGLVISNLMKTVLLILSGMR